MKEITNLNGAKELTIGEHFIYSEYFGKSIEWRKLDEHLAISEMALDCVIFNCEFNREYNKSLLFKWCNDFADRILIDSKLITILDHEKICKYLPTDESRQVKPTEWAVMHGASVSPTGNVDYWTSSLYDINFKYALVVNSLGKINDYIVNHSRVCVRPALRIR